MSKYALLIDITSIQKFIFASNKLKENLGASYLISNLFNDTVTQISPQPLLTEGSYEWYVGGGNALYFFNHKNEAESFLENWTKLLLMYTPGITVATAINEFDENENNFRNSIDNLFLLLAINKSKFIPLTIIPRHGISAECQSDGYSMDVWSKSENQYTSAATYAKIEAYEKARNNIAIEFQDLFEDNYCFTGEFDKLGQSKGSDNHIAIVHIDGNSMGDRFKQLKSLKETKSLSDTLKIAVEQSFKKLVEIIIEEIKDDKLKDYLDIKPDKNNNDKKPLPIRPIILGGDDVTFVCDGRMGIYYAKIFMEEFAKLNVSDEKPLSSCAGIAVIKTKYPFYKGYQLAEELCANAKGKRRECGGEGSWLDFHITYGGFSGSINEIREKYYQAPLGNLFYRPYRISNSAAYSFDEFIINAKKLKSAWPNNKIKELREVLTLGEDAVKTFINEAKARNLQLPHVNGEKYEDNLFDANKTKTPYFDMIEILEYYPKYLLDGEKL